MAGSIAFNYLNKGLMGTTTQLYKVMHILDLIIHLNMWSNINNISLSWEPGKLVCLWQTCIFALGPVWEFVSEALTSNLLSGPKGYMQIYHSNQITIKGGVIALRACWRLSMEMNRGLTEENTQLGFSNTQLEIFYPVGCGWHLPSPSPSLGRPPSQILWPAITIIDKRDF